MAEETRITKRTIRVAPTALRLLALNAHFMAQAKFAQMVKNIQRDGCLTGNTPFGWLVRGADGQPNDPPVYEVLSGNHRVKACIEAGLSEIDIEVTDDPVPQAWRLAKQIGDNALVGEDDPALLKLLYDEIDDVALRLYTGLDDKVLGLLGDVSVAPLSEAQLEFQTLALTFLPDEADRARAAFDAARKAAGRMDGHLLARWSDYDRAMDALEAAGAAYGVKNTATALLLVLAVFERHVDELTAGFLDEDGAPVERKRRVPTASVLGYTIPASLAAKLKHAGDHAALEALLDRAASA